MDMIVHILSSRVDRTIPGVEFYVLFLTMYIQQYSEKYRINKVSRELQRKLYWQSSIKDRKGVSVKYRKIKNHTSPI